MSENMNGMSAGNTADKTYANTKYKDTFFRYLFKEKSGMLELYNALFDDCLTDESEIEDCTIEDVFTRQMKNDLAFRVRKKRVIVLTEHQSTLNENMPLRFLTVSYTHLRAHETDSYLVCRLLLEKKKKKKPTSA